MIQKLSLSGSVLAAFTASLCCIGPLAAVALGATGFAASAVFEKWRPLSLGVTFGLLGLAWYLTYRKPKESCGEGSGCATKPVSQWSRAVLWFATAFVVAAAAFPNLASAFLSASGAGWDAPAGVAGVNSGVLKVKISGMDCAACAASIQAVLRKQPGVRNAQVRFDTREAVVQYDAAKTLPQKIVAVINGTGFKTEPLKEKEKP